MRDKFLVDPSSNPLFCLHDGFLLYNGRIWLSNKYQFVPLLLQEFHETLIRGHAGISKTLKHLSGTFYWGSMAKDVKSFVSQCVVCQ